MQFKIEDDHTYRVVVPMVKFFFQVSCQASPTFLAWSAIIGYVRNFSAWSAIVDYIGNFFSLISNNWLHGDWHPTNMFSKVFKRVIKQHFPHSSVPILIIIKYLVETAKFAPSKSYEEGIKSKHTEYIRVASSTLRKAVVKLKIKGCNIFSLYFPAYWWLSFVLLIDEGWFLLNKSKSYHRIFTGFNWTDASCIG